MSPLFKQLNRIDHIVIKDDQFENIKNEEKFNQFNNKVQIYNSLTSELKKKLWKRKYDFKKSEEIITLVNKYVQSNGPAVKYNRHRGTLQPKDENNETNKTEANKKESQEIESNDLQKEILNSEKNGDKKIGLVTDEDLIKLRKCEKKKINWKNKLYLGIFNLIFFLKKVLI